MKLSPLYDLTLESLIAHVQRLGLVSRLPKSVAGCDIVFYRIEDGDAALQEIVAMSTGRENVAVIRENVGADKDYAALYSAVRDCFDFAAHRARSTPLLQKISELFYGA